MRFFNLAALLCLAFGYAEAASSEAGAREIGLTGAVIFHTLNPRHIKAADFLSDEIERRTSLSIPTVRSKPSPNNPAVFIGSVQEFPDSYALPAGLESPEKPEGFAIWVDTEQRPAPTVYILGSDDRGMLFGAGMLIRKLDIAKQAITLKDDTRISAAPVYPVRGHKLLKKKPDLIDWYSLDDKVQLVEDLVIFGTNSFDLNHYHDPVDEKLSEVLEEFGLDLWVTLGGGRVMQMQTRQDVQEEFGGLTGLDAVAIPGGDSSGTPEHRVLIPAIARFGPLFKEVFPDAKIWFSNQCGREHAQEDNDYIFDFLNTEQPSWLEGMNYGPWTKMTIPEMRRRLCPRYKLRLKPDICHNRGCMYPVPKWERAMARTWGRNGISVMPRMMAAIHNATAELTDGFIAYNHTGISNDLNKFVFSAMAWDPDADINTVVYDYAKVFFGHEHADDVAKALLLLEDNWTDPLADNQSVSCALDLWKQIAVRMGGLDAVSRNWRLELYLTRAFIDAQVKRKYDVETENERRAYEALKQAQSLGIEQAIDEARCALARVDTEFQSREDFKRRMRSWGLHWYADLDEILDNLYHSLNERQWLEKEFDGILALHDRTSRLARIDRILHREDPGPGGFYDNLGVEGKQPHLVCPKSWHEDPGFDYCPIEFHMHEPSSKLRHSMLVSAVTRYSSPVAMRYTDLDSTARYRLKVIYNGPWRSEMICQTDDGYLIHGPQGNTGGKIMDYEIQAASTRDGALELRWQLASMTRGPSVTEVWLIRDQAPKSPQ